MSTYLINKIGDFVDYYSNSLNIFIEETNFSLPQDFFVELVRPVYEWESNRINSESKNILNNENNIDLIKRNMVINNIDVLLEENAEFFFHSWHLNIDLDEKFLKDLIIKWYRIINDFSVLLGSNYIKTFIEFSNHYCLRYGLRKNVNDEYILQLRPEVVALEELLSLKKVNSANYETFVREFSNLLVENDAHIYKNILKESSDLIELVVNDKIGSSGNTLNQAIQIMSPNFFPHLAAQESLSKIYKFYSDYRGIRHGGASSGNRPLEEKDAICFSLITIIFARYLSQ